MLSLAQIQSEVLAAVCDVGMVVPSYVEAGHDQQRRQTRFNIYRNNFYVAVINVLKERFPVTERIVGEDFFKATAREFVERTPPKGQSNLSYGCTFPEFLQSFPPVSDLPYLADVARLEWARFEAAISEDQPTVTSQDFSGINPAHAALVKLNLHTSTHVLTSDFPVYDIWRTNHEDDEVQSLRDSAGSQAVLIARSHKGIEVHQIPVAGVRFMEALTSGSTLGQAFERMSNQLSPNDMSEILALLLATGAVTGLSLPEFAEPVSTTHEN